MTIQEFLRAEMQKREMNEYQFSKLIGVSHTTIARIADGRTPIPSLDFIKKLAIGTNTNINVIVAMIFPEQTAVRPEAALLADRIQKLSPDDRRAVEAMILGLALKRRQETVNSEQIENKKIIEDNP